MPPPEAEYVSPLLSEAEVGRVWGGLPDALKEIVGDAVLTVWYGASSGLHPDLWYVDMGVGTGWLDRFMRESVERGISRPGETDLHVILPGRGVEVLLCHESDVHVRGETESAVRDVLDHPAFVALFGEHAFVPRPEVSRGA